MVAVGVVMLLRKDAEGNPDVRLSFSTARELLPLLLAIGFAVGALSGFFGIGGGFLIVPGLMLATGMPIAYAIGTSLVAVTVFGATTAANYALPAWSTGASPLLHLGGLVGGAAGTLASRTLAARKSALAMVFAGVVTLTGIYVTWQGALALRRLISRYRSSPGPPQPWWDKSGSRKPARPWPRRCGSRSGRCASGIR